MGAYGKAGIEHEHAALGPGCEKATAVGGLAEEGVVVFQGDVHIFKGRGSRGGRFDREGQAVGLVVVVVRVLAKDDDLDVVERGVAGPVIGWDVSGCFRWGDVRDGERDMEKHTNCKHPPSEGTTAYQQRSHARGNASARGTPW